MNHNSCYLFNNSRYMAIMYTQVQCLNKYNAQTRHKYIDTGNYKYNSAIVTILLELVLSAYNG